MTDLYARLGIDFDQLGCVMLDCEPPTFLHDLVPPTSWYRDPARPGWRHPSSMSPRQTCRPSQTWAREWRGSSLRCS